MAVTPEHKHSVYYSQQTYPQNIQKMSETLFNIFDQEGNAWYYNH